MSHDTETTETTEDTTTVTCGDCGTEIEVDASYYSSTTEEDYCEGCYYSAFDYASKAHLVTPGGETETYLVVSHGVYDAEYLEEAPELLVRSYHSSGGWRGYYETRPVGDDWVSAESGWTTGNWGDAIADSKQDFNTWAEAVMAGEIELDFPVWIIFDQTSNVFSTAVGVFVPEGQEVRAPSL